VLADIPGLIEGAAQGAGLGQRFLRHVERTKALVYVLDGSATDPWRDLETVRAEIAQFSSELTQRPHIVAVNKVDLEPVKKLRARTRRKGTRFVSALSGEGLPALAQDVAKLVASAPAPTVVVAPKVTRLPIGAGAQLMVERKPSGYVVRGERVENLVERTDLDSEGGLARFQSQLDRLGVNQALESAGVKPGDTVHIAGVEFEYQP